LDLRESRALMREQIAAWRDMTQPAPQPEAVAAGEGIDGQAGEGGAEAGSAPRGADARLEIVPPSAAGGQQAGVRSGIQAGGEGEMLRQERQQELHQSQETLAAREAEVAELKARVADLERLQAQQASLIEMKDSEMAAVQERLGSASEAVQATEAPAPVDQGSGLAWLWIGLALLVVAAVAWLLGRRTPRATPRPRFDSATLAAATATRGKAAGGKDTSGRAAAADATPAPADAAKPATPTWHAGAAGAPAGAATPGPGPSVPPSPSPDESREAVDGGTEGPRSEEHTSELQSRENIVCRLLLE